LESRTAAEKRIWVMGLLVACPCDKALDECPLNDARALPLSERSTLMRQMDENQLDEIIAHHKCCLREREGKIEMTDNSQDDLTPW